MPRIYLDICCLNRPFDDQTQDRIHLESEAILLILSHFESGEWEWIGSEVMELEIDEAPDAVRKSRVRLLMNRVHHSVMIESAQGDRAEHLEAEGFPSIDALHIACAESGGAEIFLTTDDRLLRIATRLSRLPHIRVENPLTWLKELTNK